MIFMDFTTTIESMPWLVALKTVGRLSFGNAVRQWSSLGAMQWQVNQTKQIKKLDYMGIRH